MRHHTPLAQLPSSVPESLRDGCQTGNDNQGQRRNKAVGEAQSTSQCASIPVALLKKRRCSPLLTDLHYGMQYVYEHLWWFDRMLCLPYVEKGNFKLGFFFACQSSNVLREASPCFRGLLYHNLA